MIIPESELKDRTALDFLEPRPASQILESTIPIPNAGGTGPRRVPGGVARSIGL